jgi:hypothetical protein
MTYVLPIDTSYSAAVECLMKNSVKGNYAPKKIYDGREIIPRMNTSCYNTKNLSKNIGYSFNLRVPLTSNNNTAIYMPRNASGPAQPKLSFNSTLLSYAR